METTIQKQIDDMGEYLFSRFMEFHKEEDVETCKAIMDEWVVDGADPDDGDVEFIWLDQINRWYCYSPPNCSIIEQTH